MSKTAKINFEKISLPKRGTLVLLVAKDSKLSMTAQELDKENNKAISKAMAIANFKGAKSTTLELIAPHPLNLERLLLIGIGDTSERTILDWRHLGGDLAGHLATKKISKSTLLVEADGQAVDTIDLAAEIAHGFTLRQYKFDKYKNQTKSKEEGKDKEKDFELTSLSLQCAEPTKTKKHYNETYPALQAGVFTARDLVNEPANILGPNDYVKRIKALEKEGLEIEVLGEKEMKKLGMMALLGVGEGSRQGSYLAVMKWNGQPKSKQPPVAIVGKGVCFDTGGISIKPSGGMEDMKGDMGGSATVVGLMQTLAKRKAKTNVIGVVGLVENMPDGQAQRPGDIVTSMSGQTIEIINTDAEGRLVLADALWYTQDKYQPSHMINLATLTGAIIVALGKEYAGLFSNNDELADQLHEAGKETGEGVWRLPMGKPYDKLIDSRFADMKNTGGRGAGSITAAQFLERHVNNTPWAHLDIAGVAMASKKSPINQSWGSGFGVDLLNSWIKENFET